MTFIKVIHESEAEGELKTVYERTLAGLRPSVRQRRGNKLPPIVRIFSLSPALIEARVGFDRASIGPVILAWGGARKSSSRPRSRH